MRGSPGGRSWRYIASASPCSRTASSASSLAYFASASRVRLAARSSCAGRQVGAAQVDRLLEPLECDVDGAEIEIRRTDRAQQPGKHHRLILQLLLDAAHAAVERFAHRHIRTRFPARIRGREHALDQSRELLRACALLLGDVALRARSSAPAMSS